MSVGDFAGWSPSFETCLVLPCAHSFTVFSFLDIRPRALCLGHPSRVKHVSEKWRHFSLWVTEWVSVSCSPRAQRFGHCVILTSDGSVYRFYLCRYQYIDTDIVSSIFIANVVIYNIDNAVNVTQRLFLNLRKWSRTYETKRPRC